MTEEEILAALVRADELLSEYVSIVRPAVDALAEMKSQYVFGETGHYDGHLGHEEAGVDTLNVRIKDEDREKLNRKEKGELTSKGMDFEDQFTDKMREKKIKYICLTGL
jgi:hypothetical protein